MSYCKKKLRKENYKFHTWNLIQLAQIRTETCANVDTQDKFNNNSTILDKILRCQISPEDKTKIGYKRESVEVSSKGGPVSKQNDTSRKMYDMEETQVC